MVMRWIIAILFILLIEVYAFQAVKTLTKERWILSVYQASTFLINIFIIYRFTQFDRSVGQTSKTLFTIGFLLLTFVPKLIVSLILIVEDIYRIFSGTFSRIAGNSSNTYFLPERRKFVTQVALGIAAVPFLSLIYGMTKGKYNFKVIKQTLFFPDLPEAFEGFTITQISDIHSGSFDDAEKIKYAIDLINQQNSDLLLFTGDIVNTHAKEMHPWIEIFNTIKTHPFGKFSVLGNHDYGEYVTWKTKHEKEANFEAIKQLHDQIGFKLLMNEHVLIPKDQDQMALVGVENWGHNFKKAGDLNKASAHLPKEAFKILMSHDPSHWEYEVKNHEKHFHLTLSGHTHGMQFGIEIPGFKWSLAQYVYKQWAGLYENAGRYIYVNRGFGFHAYPGRVGIWPEITKIELRKGPHSITPLT